MDQKADEPGGAQACAETRRRSGRAAGLRRLLVAGLVAVGATATVVPLASSATGQRHSQLRSGHHEPRGRIAATGALTAIPGFASARSAASARTAAAPASKAPSPPFRECPAIGNDQSCGILIYVTDSGAQVLADPSQGPYDGGDDTLVGIVNASSKPLSSISLSSGTDIFGFDGDGICAYTNWTGDAKCPYGPTGYEGPGTHFPVTAGDSGPVVFAPKLSGNGGSAYFGLEEALSNASLVNTKAYAALGDSYSAGVGTENSKWSSACDRGPGAWPKLLSSLGGLTFTGDPTSPADSFFACSGATSTQELHGDVSKHQPNQVFELEEYATRNGTPGVVTLTAGGNDVGFADLLTACRLNTIACEFELAGGLRYLTKGAKPFEESLTKLYEGAAKAAGHGARIEAVGYPRIFPTSISWLRLNLHCKWLAGVPGAISQIYQLTTDLNDDIRQAAGKAHVSYASTENAVSGHELCTGESWIAALELINAIKHIAGHPLPKGQEALAKTVLQDLQSSGGPLAVRRAAVARGDSASTAKPSRALSEVGLAISVAELPAATTGDPYLGFFAASGGNEPYVWSVSKGSLPAGLALDASTGVVAGTPTGTGTSKFTITATDSSSPAATSSKALTLVVGAKSSLQVNTKGLAPATVGQQYEFTLETTGGTEPDAWTIEPGSLPAGLTLDPETGTISGTPTAAGTAKVSFRANDSTEPSQAATKALTLTVAAAGEPLAISAFTAPAGKAGEYYGLRLSSLGGSAPVTWSVTGGRLPAGVAMDPNSGQIAGVPTESGSFPITITATDRTTPTPESASVEGTISIAASTTLSILTPTAPSATQGSAYVATLNAEGGVPGYTWQVTSGNLPPGLTLSSESGSLEGVPAESGSFTFTATVSDGSTPTPQSASDSYTIKVAASSPALTFAPPEATLNVPYSYTPEASGGVEPYTWSISSGELPAGLSLNESTGTISGTPTAAGTRPVTLRLADSSQPAPQSVSGSGTLTVAAAPPLSFESSVLPSGVDGQPYRAVLFVSGGTEPYAFTITHGSLPAGLSLEPGSGVISGTPEAEGKFEATIKVSDASEPIQQRTETLTLNVTPPAPLTIETSELAEATAGNSFSQALIATGGTEPYAWTITSGVLPHGLTLSENTGDISGTPTESGTFTFTAKTTDAGSPTAQSATATLTLTVSPTSPLQITSSSMPEGTQGNYYDQQIEAQGGVSPDTWSLASGALPEGLSLDPNSGTIYGTPSGFGTASFTVQATDSSFPTAQVASRKLQIKITPDAPFAMGATSLSSGTQGQYYAQYLELAGGVAPYTIAVTGGTLPEGLAISSNGYISGEITSEHSETFTLSAYDSSTPHAQSASRQFTIGVTPAPALEVASTVSGFIAGQYGGQSVGVSGGVPGYSCTLDSGKLPAGLTFSNGYIYGTPTKTGKTVVTLTVTDAATPTAHRVTKSVSVVVSKAPKLTILTKKLPAGIHGSYYQQPVSITGGSYPFTWSISTGALPPGMFQSGEYIYGTPETTGTYAFTVKVVDSSAKPQSAAKKYTLKIS